MQRRTRAILQRGHSMRAPILRFVNDQSAATAIEYSLIAAGIALVIVAAVASLGTSVNATFGTVSAAVK